MTSDERLCNKTIGGRVELCLPIRLLILSHGERLVFGGFHDFPFSRSFVVNAAKVQDAVEMCIRDRFLMWYSRHTLNFPARMFSGERFKLQVRSGYKCLMRSSTAYMDGMWLYGP